MKCLRVLVKLTLYISSDTPGTVDYTLLVYLSNGTAKGGVDYQSEVYNVTVEAEETSAEVSLIFGDSIVEVKETFTADLSVPVAEAALGVSVSATDGTAYVEIQDDDMAYITSHNMSYQVTEGSGYVTVTLLVIGQVSVEFTVVVDITGGTATESSDYLGQMYNVTILAGETLTNFTVTILDDAILEEEELFSLALSIPPYPASLGIHSSAYATVTVTDDDFLTVQFAECSYSVSEGAGEVVLNLTANGTSAVNYTVVVDTVDKSAAGVPCFIAPGSASGMLLSAAGGMSG